MGLCSRSASTPLWFHSTGSSDCAALVNEISSNEGIKGERVSWERMVDYPAPTQQCQICGVYTLNGRNRLEVIRATGAGMSVCRGWRTKPARSAAHAQFADSTPSATAFAIRAGFKGGTCLSVGRMADKNPPTLRVRMSWILHPRDVAQQHFLSGGIQGRICVLGGMVDKPAY